MATETARRARRGGASFFATGPHYPACLTPRARRSSHVLPSITPVTMATLNQQPASQASSCKEPTRGSSQPALVRSVSALSPPRLRAVAAAPPARAARSPGHKAERLTKALPLLVPCQSQSTRRPGCRARPRRRAARERGARSEAGPWRARLPVARRWLLRSGGRGCWSKGAVEALCRAGAESKARRSSECTRSTATTTTGATTGSAGWKGARIERGVDWNACWSGASWLMPEGRGQERRAATQKSSDQRPVRVPAASFVASNKARPDQAPSLGYCSRSGTRSLR